MDNPKQNYAALVLFACMLSLVPEIGFSLGLGQIKLYSYLNEPLDAEIELQDVENIDTKHLIVALASIDDFKHIELARPYSLSELRFEVLQKNKQAILKVTSEDVVKQPYLEFLVQFTWPEGRAVRGYTLLLDPAPFGGVSKRVANEQALQMLNKVDLTESPPSEAPERLESASVRDQLDPSQPPVPEKIAQQEDMISPTPISETKKHPVMEIQSAINQIQATPAIEPKSTLSRKQILLGGGLTLLLGAALIACFLRRTRPRIRRSSESNEEDIVMFDEAIKLKLDLANQYLSCQDVQNAEAILDEIIARGNPEERKLAKEILKKCK